MAWTTPRTWVTGELVTAALLNTHLRDNLAAITESDSTEWIDYVPTYTNLTSTTPTIVARYQIISGIVTVRWSYILGSTPTVGDVRVSLPVSAATSGYQGLITTIGAAGLHDANGSNWQGTVLFVDATTVAIRTTNVGATHPFNAVLSSTVPFTWVVTDRLTAQWIYEAA